MKKLLLFICTLAFAAIIPLSASAESEYRAALFDDAGVLTYDDEEILLEEMNDVVATYNINVGVVITVNKGGKGSMEFADDYYDEIFGKDTTGILLMLDNEEQYDWISTSGKAIDYYSDYAIEQIFDYFYYDLDNGNYFATVDSFLLGCKLYYGVEGTSTNLDVFDDGGDGVYLMIGAIALVIFIIALVAEACAIKSSYGGSKGVATDYYSNNEQLYYRTKSDYFVKEYTTSVTVSSSSHSSGGGSHHSSHRSSSGGRHGGGGRHR